MVDAVVVKTLFAGENRHIVQIFNVSDGTGEAAVIKVDKSVLIGPVGLEPSQLAIERMAWNISGMSVKIEWEHTTNDIAAILSGQGDEDYQRNKTALYDPKSTGGTGDLVITTIGHALGDTYDIIIDMKLKA